MKVLTANRYAGGITKKSSFKKDKIFQSLILVCGLINLLFWIISSSTKPQDDRFQMVLEKLAEESTEVGRLKAIIKNWEAKAGEGEEKK